jgi:parallel beta-helix repeat protein
MSRSLSLAVLAVLAASAPAARGRTIEVSSGESIQAAVDRAAVGDTISVQPGTYAGEGGLALVHVRKSGLRLEAPRSAVIDARGYRYGILVGDDGPVGIEGCVATSVRSFTIDGFTVRSASQAGLRLTGVDGFSVRGGAYLENGAYGVRPRCAAHGLISDNFLSGHRQAAIHVGDSDHVVVESNSVTESGVGAVIENSSFAVLRHNQIFGNAAGIVVLVRANLPLPVTDHVRIAENVIVQNDLPNPVPADGGDDVGAIPSGSGILNAGGDHVSIERNIILGNDSFGLATTASPFALADPRIDPFPDDQRVARNVILLNGQSPDRDRPTPPGADIVFVPGVADFAAGVVLTPDPDSSDDCFSDNRFFTENPTGVTEGMACP